MNPRKSIFYFLQTNEDLPASAILELFGQFFFEFCVESGFDKILSVLGSTTRDFLENLDALHDHLSTIYPGLIHRNNAVVFFFEEYVMIEIL